ncbi:MAG: FG-GAP-like repeat-containing protein [Planctomycetota bacterium]
MCARVGVDNVAVVPVAASGAFGTPVSSAIPAAAERFALADLDGDGAVDLVTSDRVANHVSVLLGLGDGSFGPATSYAAGFGPRAITVADVDGDDVLDVVASNLGSAELSILTGVGDGSLSSATTLFVATQAKHLEVADLDGDGNDDLVLGGTGWSVAVLRGTGGGSFGAPTYLPVGGGDWFGSDGIADLTVAEASGDGVLDVLVSNRDSGALCLLVGRGDGSFETNRAFESLGTPGALAIGDVDGDGDRDAVVAGLDGLQFVVLLGRLLR